jgi:hypothetical protein
VELALDGGPADAEDDARSALGRSVESPAIRRLFEVVRDRRARA